MSSKQGQGKKKLLIRYGIAAALILCVAIVVTQLDHTKLIRSDSSGVEFETEDNRITCVSVKGKFPYSRVLCPHERESVQDSNGNVIEVVDTYTMTADISLLGRSVVSMKLDIEASDDAARTYILKFADGDMRIINGKVVDSP